MWKNWVFSESVKVVRTTWFIFIRDLKEIFVLGTDNNKPVLQTQLSKQSLFLTFVIMQVIPLFTVEKLKDKDKTTITMVIKTRNYIFV